MSLNYNVNICASTCNSVNLALQEQSISDETHQCSNTLKNVHTHEARTPIDEKQVPGSETTSKVKEKHFFSKKRVDSDVDINLSPEMANVLFDPKVASAMKETENYRKLLRDIMSSGDTQCKINKLIIEAIKEGKYRQKIVPFDIWDFGGQKEFYMTHQLFITSRGVFVLMFNGSKDLRVNIASMQEPFYANTSEAGMFNFNLERKNT